MYVLTAPSGIRQLYTRDANQYTVSAAGTISVPLSDLPDALAAGFTVGSGSAPVSSQNISGAVGTVSLSTQKTYLFVNTSSAPASLALPAATGSNNEVVVIDISGNAAANNITISNTVVGTATIGGNFNTLSLVDNGTSWSII